MARWSVVALFFFVACASSKPAPPAVDPSVEPTIVGPDGDDQWRAGLFVIEDQLVVTADGIEVLTGSMPRELVRR